MAVTVMTAVMPSPVLITQTQPRVATVWAAFPVRPPFLMLILPLCFWRQALVVAAAAAVPAAAVAAVAAVAVVVLAQPAAVAAAAPICLPLTSLAFLSRKPKWAVAAVAVRAAAIRVLGAQAAAAAAVVVSTALPVNQAWQGYLYLVVLVSPVAMAQLIPLGSLVKVVRLVRAVPAPQVV